MPCCASNQVPAVHFSRQACRKHISVPKTMPYTPSCSCRPGRQTQNSVTLSNCMTTLKVQARMMVKVSDQQNMSSPVLIRHCVTLLSEPAHAKAETWGGTFPHRLLPSLHPENPAEPAKPIALQATLPCRLAPKLVCEPNTFPIVRLHVAELAAHWRYL